MAAPLRVGPRTVGVVQIDWLEPRPSGAGRDRPDRPRRRPDRAGGRPRPGLRGRAERAAAARAARADVGDVLGESLDFRAALGEPRPPDRAAPGRLVRDRPGRGEPVAPDLGRPLRPGQGRARPRRSCAGIRRTPTTPSARACCAPGAPSSYAEVPAAFVEQAAGDDEHRAILRGLGMRSVIVVPLTRARPHARDADARHGRVRPHLRTTTTSRSRPSSPGGRRRRSTPPASTRTATRSRARSSAACCRPTCPTSPASSSPPCTTRPAAAATSAGTSTTRSRPATATCSSPSATCAGRAPPAAALTGIARHTVRAAAVRERSPRAILRTLNQALLRQVIEHRFCTVAVGRLEPTDRRGPPDRLLRRPPAAAPDPQRRHASRRRAPRGRCSASTSRCSSPISRSTLDPGDAVVFHTDGVTEERREGQHVRRGAAARAPAARRRA